MGVNGKLSPRPERATIHCSTTVPPPRSLLPGHGQYGPLLVVVAVTLVDVLLEHGEHAHHADRLLARTVDAVLVPVQHTQRVVGRLQPVEAGLDEILVDLHL